ncbi:MAG: nucleotide exchange factor GrpE [Spirochaetaceae bacterium]|nr:nucleotide exchange factor GrpE [Spirochaetaceae bacterium]
MNEREAGAEEEQCEAPEAAATAQSAPCEADEPKESGAEEKITALEAKLAEANDQFLRKAADFENFRKRMAKEKQEAIDFANQNLLLDIIPVLDDFERALSAAEDGGKSETGFQNLLEGIKMIQQRMLSTLESKWRLKRFDSKDAVFDPLRHEALMVEKSGDVNEALVMEDLIKGYTLKDRVVRTAKVKVIMPLDT